MNAKHVLLASFAVVTCTTFTPAFATGADDTWLAYRAANNLPVDATPSNPAVSSDEILLEMSFDEGNADGAALVRGLVAKHGNGNGNGNGHTNSGKKDCPAEFPRNSPVPTATLRGRPQLQLQGTLKVLRPPFPSLAAFLSPSGIAGSTYR